MLDEEISDVGSMSNTYAGNPGEVNLDSWRNSKGTDDERGSDASVKSDSAPE